MSRIDFDALINKHPESEQALRELETWMKDHGDPKVIYPKDVARQVQDVDPVALVKALMLLVEEGELRRLFKVEDPNGVLTNDVYDDIGKIPEKLPDRNENYFEIANYDVVPIFEKVA
jgi:hypothetical protein